MSMKIKPADDRFHVRSGSPYWNESGCFSFMVPERDLDGMVYFYHRPNMLKSSGGVIMWDPSGEEDHDCVFYEFDEHLALPPEANMFDFELRNTLKCRTVELQKVYHMTFQREGFEIDLTWTAITPPHGSREPEELDRHFRDAGMSGWIRGKETPQGYKPDPIGTGGNEIGHYDQFGRMTGTITIDGEKAPIDCVSLRDRSWGPRGISPDMPRNRIDWGCTPQGEGFYVFSCAEKSWKEDKVVDLVDIVVDGCYIKDGVVGDVIKGTSRVLERDEQNRPLRMVLDAEDHLSRKLHAEGVRKNALNWFGYSFCYILWAMAEWKWDGHTERGEVYEMTNQRQHRRMVQNAKKRPRSSVGSLSDRKNSQARNSA